MIDATTIDTNNAMRDDHIHSADFFGAENHPTFTFVIDGDLTIRGITKPVTLAVETPEFGPKPRGGMKAGISASTEINRSDFGVSYNGPIPGGGVALAEKVQIVLDIEADLKTDDAS